MIKFILPRKKFQIEKDETVITKFVSKVARNAHDVFNREHSKKGKGRIYKRKGRIHQASLAGDYPAKDLGLLMSGTEVSVSSKEAALGTNVHYATYLNNGTSKMGARKMYKDALNTSIAQGKFNLNGFISFK